jgi:hypothetical protein
MVLHILVLGGPGLLGFDLSFLPEPMLKPQAAVFLIGLVQIPYVGLAYGLLRATGRINMAAGVMRGGLLTAIVNLAGCGAFWVAISTARW